MGYFEEENLNSILESRNIFKNGTKQNGNEIWTGDSVTSAGRIICVLLLRIGFLLVQVGSIPVENVYIIIFRNIIEMAVAIFSYGFVGYCLSYGSRTIQGVINYDGFIGDKHADLSNATIGFSACLIGTAIISSFLVARLRQPPMLVLTFLFSALFQPILICWCWSRFGWMTRFKLLDQRVTIQDYGGNLVVHVPSAIVGLVGALILGRRIMKVKDVDKFSLGNEYISGTVTGYLFIIIGHIGFNLPSAAYEARHEVGDYISHVTVNGLMAMGGGILVVSFLHALVTRDVYKYWIMVKCLQGGLAGMVIVAAGIDIYSPPINFGIASIGALIFFFTSNLIHQSSLEDCCNITAIYLVCGALGLLIPPILASGDNLGLVVTSNLRLVHLLWQFICLMFIIIITAVLFLIIFALLYLSRIFKNQFEKVNHQRAKILYGRLPWRRYFDRIFMISNNSKEISPESNRSEISQTFTAV